MNQSKKDTGVQSISQNPTMKRKLMIDELFEKMDRVLADNETTVSKIKDS